MIKVAIIDDYVELLEELKECLSLFDYEIHTFTDGFSTIEKLEKIRPDVLLLDLKLKDENGLDVAREARRHDKLAALPIIAITGCYTEEELDDITGNQVIDMLLTKPLNIDEVVRKINYMAKKQ